MKYYITGISGFVASHMTDFILEKDKNAIIYGLIRWRSDKSNIKHLLDNERLKLIEGDLLDVFSLRDSITKIKPDYILHFAAQSSPHASFFIPAKTLETNVIGTANLLQTIREAKDQNVCSPTILSVSSSEVYGCINKEDTPVKETQPFRPANPYSISKVGHDLLSQFYQQSYGLKIIITRMFSHEGARRGTDFALSSFALQIVKNENIFKHLCVVHYDAVPKYRLMDNYKDKKFVVRVGNLDSIRTYAHIDDAINAYWLCLTKAKIGEIYNIGGEETCKVGDVLNKLISKSIIPIDKFEIVVDSNLFRPMDISWQIPDCTKFKKDTGWELKKGLNEICDDLLNYWRDILG